MSEIYGYVGRRGVIEKLAANATQQAIDTINRGIDSLAVNSFRMK